MKWFRPRIGTLMLFVIIVALMVALVIERRRSASYMTSAQNERNRADREAMYAEYRANLLIQQSRHPAVATPKAIGEFRANMDARSSSPPKLE
jgi:hypothetical protein